MPPEIALADDRKVLMLGLPATLDATLGEHLARAGWEVRRAADGRDALRRWDEVGAPAVVTDLDGGGADAFDVFELARLDRPPHVIVCTPHALAEQLDAETLSLLGVAAVLRMPCVPETIVRALAALPRAARPDARAVLQAG